MPSVRLPCALIYGIALGLGVKSLGWGQEGTLALNFRLDGQPLHLEAEEANEVLMVPAKPFLEALGAKEVRWDPQTRFLTARMAQHELRLQGVAEEKAIAASKVQKTARLDGEEVLLSMPLTLAEGTSLVPLRDLAEALGATVDWDRQTVSIWTPDYWARRLGLPAFPAQRYGRFHLRLGSLFPGERLVLWFRSDTDVFLQIYELVGGDPPWPLFGVNEEGEVVFDPLALGLPPQPRLLRAEHTEQCRQRVPGAREVAYVAIASTQEPTEDPLSLLKDGRGNAQTWVITGIEGQLGESSVLYGRHIVEKASPLGQVATELGVTEDHLREVNGLRPTEEVRPGDVLYYEIGFKPRSPQPPAKELLLPCMGRVKGAGAALFSKPDGPLRRYLPAGTPLKVWRKLEKWYIARWEGEDYAIPSGQVELTGEPVTWTPPRTSWTVSQSRRLPWGIIEQMLDYAWQWRGVPYVLGGHTRRGIDCSSFVRECFAHVGLKLKGRTTRQQCNEGRRVHEKGQPISLLQPGDRLFFYSPRGRLKNVIPKINHTALYMGNGQMIHAQGGTGVVVTPFRKYEPIYLFAQRGVD